MIFPIILKRFIYIEAMKLFGKYIVETYFLLFLHCFEIFTISINIPPTHQPIKGRIL